MIHYARSNSACWSGLSEILPGDLSGIQFYDSGATAVEAALRVARAATQKHEFLSCYGDFHGKSGHAVSLGPHTRVNGPTRNSGLLYDAAPQSVSTII